MALHRLAQCYVKMIPFYDKICSLAQAQEKCLQDAAPDTDQLFEYVQERQELIEILESHNAVLYRIKEEIRSALGLEEFAISRIKCHIQGDGLSALEHVAAKVSAVLDRIREYDKRNEEALRFRMDETRENIKRLQQTKVAHKAYRGKPKQRDGVLIDFSK